MSNQKQLLLILERSGENLSVSKTNDEYVLEGVFAQFGVENNNHRIYEEKEYLPHLDYLKKKIEEKRLLGELDHPDKFDVSLQKVSHLIEDVKYDAKKRQIIGRIKLLDTPAGQIAKNLVDTGVPISISSRAAGVVKENKKVEIKRIFTYDLVADPGFENAQLAKVNESFGFDPHDDNLAIYDVTKVFPAFLESFSSEEINNTEKIQKTMDHKEYVSVDEMNKYSLVIKKEIEKMNEKLSSISQSTDGSDKIAKLEEELENLKGYASYLANSHNNAIAYANYLAEKLSQGIAYSEHIAEKSDKGIQYAEMVAEQLDKGQKYVDYVAKKLDESIQYSDYTAKKVDETIQYAEYAANKIDESIRFGNYLANKINETIGYAEHIAEHTENVIQYGEYLAENLATKEDFQNLTEYTEYMFENSVYSPEGKTRNVSEGLYNKDRGLIKGDLKESISKRYASLDNKIEAVLESVKKQRAELKTTDSRYPFMAFLSEGNREAFLALSETEKKRVVNALSISPAFEEEKILKVWESALASVETNEKWLTNMPVEYLGLWESASAETKDLITRAAKKFRLETDYQIKNFWQTRGLGKPSEDTTVINESKKVELAKSTNALGYSLDYVKAIAERL